MTKHVDQILDEMLILQIKSGDNEAFRLLVIRWQTQFSKFAFMISQDQDMALEAVQEAWLSIIKNLFKLKDPSVFKSWALKIVYHKSIDLLRHVAKSTDLTNQVDTVIDDGTLQALENKNEIEKILQSLDEPHRAVLALHFLQELSIKETSEFLNIAEGTVKSRIFHAKKTLRQQQTIVENQND